MNTHFQFKKISLKDKARGLEAIVRIGKNGLTESIINEIKKQLKIRKLIKIKFLKSAIEDKDKRQFAEDIAKQTNSELIDSVGFTVTLYKGR